MNVKNITTALLFVAIFTLCVFSTPVDVNAVNTDIVVSTTPRIPGPNEKVFVNLISYGVDLDRSDISWYKDGELVLSGQGETQYSFIMKGLGLQTNFNIYIQSGGLKQTQISKTFVSSVVDLLWEATQSYTPPFYKGKALPASQERIRVIAVPNVTSVGGVKSNPNNLIYKWKKNGKYRDFNNQSGYNKKSVVFTQDLFNTEELVVVEVSSNNWDVSAEGRVGIERTQPEIQIYHDNPLEGVVYESVLSKDFLMENKEIGVVAEPYYFSTYNKDFGDIIFNWRVDNKKIEVGESNMVFGFEKDSVGSSNMSLDMTHVNNILQSAKTSFKLKYGETESFFNTFF